jgi:hypothetical protein
MDLACREVLPVFFPGGCRDKGRDGSHADRLAPAGKPSPDTAHSLAWAGPGKIPPGSWRQQQAPAAARQVDHDHGGDPVTVGQGLPPVPDRGSQRPNRLPDVHPVAVNPAASRRGVLAGRPGDRFDQDKAAPGADRVRDPRCVPRRYPYPLEDPHTWYRQQLTKQRPGPPSYFTRRHTDGA